MVAMKHEQAIIVGLSYVIGFTTAFIALSFVGSGSRFDGAKEIVISKTERAIVPAARGAAIGGQGVRAVTNDEGLFLLKDGKERIISAVSNEAAAAEDGYHSQIVTATVSPSGQYVYYCAVLQAAARECSHFVYSVKDDLVKRVNKEGKPFASTAEEALFVSWASDDSLHISSAENAAAPDWSIR